VKTMVINISPMVFGSFRNRTLIYPKTAEIKTSIVIIKK
jgi:hypothetical protein